VIGGSTRQIVETRLVAEASLGKQVEDISQGAAVCLVHLCVFAPRTGHSGELAALNIEQFGQKATSRPELAGFVLCVRTLGALEIRCNHVLVSHWLG
jgi:hypothetical protein